MQGRGDDLAVRDGSSYFEKVCLRGAEVQLCSKRGWAFERVPNMKLEGYDDREYSNIPTRRECEELCLKNKCRSAGYNSVTLTCTLSNETRRTKPKDYRTARGYEYLENGCIDTSKSCMF